MYAAPSRHICGLHGAVRAWRNELSPAVGFAVRRCEYCCLRAYVRDHARAPFHSQAAQIRPDDRLDAAWASEKAAREAHAERLRFALNAFAKAAMDVQATHTGTIGRRAAETHARTCRANVNTAIAELVKRERLDAHARSYLQIAAYINSMEPHAASTPEEVEFVRALVDEIQEVIDEHRANMEAQRAKIDESIRRA